MKKLLIIAVALAIGSLAQASELWWTLNDTVSVDGGEAVAWSKAELYANSSGYNNSEHAGDSELVDTVYSLFDKFESNIDGISSSSSFYVELYDAQNEFLGRSYVTKGGSSDKPQGAATLAMLRELGAIDDGPTPGGSMTPYTGFNQLTTQTVVPEPTSGLLVALGMMLLGLKRKRT